MKSAPTTSLTLILLLIVLLAFGLRLYGIDRQDVWGDEAFSIWLSSQPLAQVVAGGADTHPPLYPFLLALWLRLSGTSPLAARALSAFAGTLLVPVVYVLGHRLLGPVARHTGPGAEPGHAAALLATLLVAVSPALIYYAQETRMYGLVTLLAAASVYWSARLYRAPRSVGAALGCFLAGIAAAYTHYYALFVLLAENVVLLPALLRSRERAGARRWLAVQAAMALAYLPWIAVQSGFLEGKASARFGEWGTAALHIASETATTFAGGPALARGPALAVALAFSSAVAAGLFCALRQAADARRNPAGSSGRVAGLLLSSYLLLPLVLAWAVDPIMPFFYARYLLLIAPAFYLLAALGLAALLRQPWLPLGIASILILLAGSTYGLTAYYTGQGAAVKGRYGQMMAYVVANAQPGDALLLANPLQRPIFEYYRPAGLEAYYYPRHDYPLEDERTWAELATIATRHPRLWLVRFGNPAEYDPEGTLTRWLASQGSKAYFGGWSDADLSLYVMAPAATEGSIPNRLDLQLGEDVRLLGYALGSTAVAPGESLLLTLYWQALAPMQERYTVFTHLLDGNGQILAQVDSEPAGGGWPTDRWLPGDVVRDNYALTVSPTALPGPHLLEVGMYLLATMERLPVQDRATGSAVGDHIVLATVEVVKP
jgi:mannosyltransferase